MTTCPFCLEHWAARSAKQLANRKANMYAVPDAGLALCPKCGGTDWATTDAMIDVKPSRPSMLRRLRALLGMGR